MQVPSKLILAGIGILQSLLNCSVPENVFMRICRERQAAEGDREKLLLEAQNAEKDHSGLLASLQGLESEVERAEREAAIKQQEYIDARNRAQSAATRLDELR